MSGSEQWRDLPSWPPAAQEQVLYPQPGGLLGAAAAAADAPPATFTYGPTDPTPVIGGRLFEPKSGGYKDDSTLAERSDVLAFTGPKLDAALTIIGVPRVELAHHSDNPHADLFVRLSEVDTKGRSKNVTDGFVRLEGADAAGTVRIALDATAHEFAFGSRIRLLIAGGCFPRFERNLGTHRDPGTSTEMATVPPHDRSNHVSARAAGAAVTTTPVAGDAARASAAGRARAAAAPRRCSAPGQGGADHR